MVALEDLLEVVEEDMPVVVVEVDLMVVVLEDLLEVVEVDKPEVAVEEDL